MSTTTDQQRSLADLKEDYRRLRLQVRVRQLERATKLLENFQVTDWVGPYVDLLDRYRDGRQLLSPISTPNDRRFGKNFPLWQTEQELALLRAPARILCATNPYAIGLLSGLTSYVIGTGYTYRATPKSDGAGSLVAKTQDVLDEFCERTEWGELEQELFWRSREDGEYFLRHGYDDDGLTWVRTVEPEQVFQPPGQDQRAWSFGILTETDPEDVQTRRAYWVASMDNSAQGEEVPAHEIVHAAVNCKRSIKRGLTDFSFGLYDALDVAGRLRRNLGEGAAIQAALAGIRQHDSASQAQIQSFQGGTVDYSVQDPVTGRGQDNTRWLPGTIHDVPKGQNWVDPPGAANAEAHVAVLQACLRGAGVRWNAPEWLASGDASNNNYASSLTAESPFVLTVKRWQRYYELRFLRTMHIVIAHAIAARRLPPDTLRLVDIQCEAPSPIARDPQKDSQVNQTYVQMGVKSRQTVAQEQGLDWDVEQQNIQQWEKEHPQQQDQGDGDQGGADRGRDGQRLGEERLPETSGGGVHAPAGYTDEKPLMIQGHPYKGGEFVPPDVVAKATKAEKAALKKEGPAAKGKEKAKGKAPTGVAGAAGAGGVAGYPRPAARNGRDADASGLPARGTKAQNLKPWDPVEKAEAIAKTLKRVDGGKPGSWTQANATVMEEVFAHALNFDWWGKTYPADIAGVVKVQGKATRVGIDLKTATTGKKGDIKKDDNAESLKVGFVTEGLDQGGFNKAASLSGNPDANVKSLMFFLAVNANGLVKEVPAVDPKTGRRLKDEHGQPVMQKAALLYLQATVRADNYRFMVPIEVEGLNDVSDLTKPEVLAKVREKVLAEIQATDTAQFAATVKQAGDKLHTRLIGARSRQDSSLEAAGVQLDAQGKAQAAAGRALKSKERAQAKAREAAKALKQKDQALQQLAASDPKLAAKLRKAGLI